MNTLAPPYDESATTEEMLFALARRDQPTVAFVECASLAKRNELETLLAASLPEYQFHTIDVTPYPVVSLLRTLTEQLPAEVRESAPVRYVVHVHGLENSLRVSQDGRLVPSQLTAQLNLERELLFRSVPYIIILWGDAQFFRTLQREAPDLWHWVTYHFRFEDYTARLTEDMPPLPPERLPQPGDIAERQVRIAELEDRYAHLLLDGGDKKRLLRDKVDILTLLAEEYAGAFQYAQAVEKYRMAIALQHIIGVNDYQHGYLLFGLAFVYLELRQFEEALESYNQCKELVTESEYGALYHQIGIVYECQYQWTAALDSYEQALKWHEQTGQIVQLSATYQQIGSLYQEQQQWIMALSNYEKALEWNSRINHKAGLGRNYHQIGMLYEHQQQWDAALDSYEQALKWKRQADNVFELGSTYHHIGNVYEAQRQWIKALDNYKESIKWKEQAGNTATVGKTYYQIALLYEKQGALTEALSWLEKTAQSLSYTRNPFLPVVQEHISKVEAELVLLKLI